MSSNDLDYREECQYTNVPIVENTDSNPCFDYPCLISVSQSSVRMTEINDLTVQVVLALVYGALFSYIIKVQKTKKNMLFYVTCMLFSSAIFGIISNSFLILVDKNC